MSSFQNKNDSTRLYGKYRARVLNISDPEMRGRVLVECPKVLNHHELGWAESCFMPGHFFIPRKDDLVWIEFEEGDVHKPIWTGIMPTRQYVRDYLMLSPTYYHTRGFIRKYESWIDIGTQRINAAVSEDINLTATREINVAGTKLSNNRYWDFDKIN